MGSKNLKAIAVRGTGIRRPVFDREMVGLGSAETSVRPQPRPRDREVPHYSERWRTSSVFDRLGALPTRNFQQSTFEEAVARSAARTLHQRRTFVKNAHCANCTIGCEKIFDDRQTAARSPQDVWSMRACSRLARLWASRQLATRLYRASHYCDEAGMDTVSAGATDSMGHGVLRARTADHSKTPDASSFDLGICEDALTALLEMYSTDSKSKRKNRTASWLKGARRASSIDGTLVRTTGRCTSRGWRCPDTNRRSLKTMALASRGQYTGRVSQPVLSIRSRFLQSRVNRFGGRRRPRQASPPDGERTSQPSSTHSSGASSSARAFDDFYGESAAIYEHVTGWSMTPEELGRAGERISNLKKLFNIREGWRRSDDTLPSRVLEERLPTGVVRGVGLTRDELDSMIAGVLSRPRLDLGGGHTRRQAPSTGTAPARTGARDARQSG